MILRVISRIALAVLYFVVVTPAAIVRRAIGGDPMHHKAGDMGYWHQRPSGSNEAAAMQRPS